MISIIKDIHAIGLLLANDTFLKVSYEYEHLAAALYTATICLFCTL